MMKILLANNSLSMLAGSETWTHTLALQLKKMGHKVEGFSPELGIISEDLEKNDIPCVSAITNSGVKPFSILLEPKKEFSYDVIICAHNHIARYLRAQFPKTPIICVIHGIIHKMQGPNNTEVDAPEHPATDVKIDQYIAVSEEIQQLLKREYNIDSILLRNFFDIEKFTSKTPVTKDKPRMFLVNSNYTGNHDPEMELIREVAKHYDAKLAAIGMNFALSLNPMQAIEEADVVVGMGRSVLEGLSAGRLAIVNGRWGTGGVIRENNVEELRACNFSGRNSGGRLYTKEELIAEIDQYFKQETMEWGRNYIRREHNAETAAEYLLTIAKCLIDQNNIPAEKQDIIRPYRRAK